MDNSFYKAAVETMQDGLLVVNTDGIIMAVNTSFETMSGYSSRELVGRRCTMLNCTGCKILGGNGGAPWCGMFIRGGIRNRRCRLEAKNGARVDAIKSATVLRDESGQVTGAVETLSDISEMVRQEERINLLRSNLKVHSGNFGILGSSTSVQRLLDMIRDVAQSEAPVLIYGESGVGKELVAQAIHGLGQRAEGAFIKVNCASLNENLLESELFGHVKGAFTGAGRDRVGRFEAASRGTIFLDEIGDVSSSMQVKLLRVLEAREVERVGDHRPIPVDARVITATNKELEHLVAQGAFRSDLFYRINVVPVFVPPLRERKEDIPLLAQTFIDQIASRSNKSIVGLHQDALDMLLSYNWPGNVRELRNVIEYAFVLCREGLIEPGHIVHRINCKLASTSMAPREHAQGCEDRFFGAKSQKERERLLRALRETGGNQSEAARILGVSRVTIWKRMKKFGIKWVE
jgi:two-component system, NtrC family, response regulator HydG